MISMAKSNQINVRVNDPTYEAIEKYAEKYDLTQAEAIREMSQRVLRGEGYLTTPGPAIPDGGLEQKLDQNQEEITQTKEKIEEVQTEQNHLLTLLMISVAWIALELVGDPIWYWTISTGGVLSIALVYLFAKQYILN